MHPTKSIFIGLTVLIAAIAISCKSPGVHYTNSNPERFEIKEVYQPVYLIVTNKSGSRVPAPSEGKQQVDHVETNAQRAIYDAPDLVVYGILRDLLVRNGAVVTKVEDQGVPFEVVIQEYSIERDNAKWNSKVRLQAVTPEYEQRISSAFTRPDLLGTRDADQAMSQALSAAIDSIKWKDLFP